MIHWLKCQKEEKKLWKSDISNVFLCPKPASIWQMFDILRLYEIELTNKMPQKSFKGQTWAKIERTWGLGVNVDNSTGLHACPPCSLCSEIHHRPPWASLIRLLSCVRRNKWPVMPSLLQRPLKGLPVIRKIPLWRWRCSIFPRWSLISCDGPWWHPASESPCACPVSQQRCPQCDGAARVPPATLNTA